MLNSSKNLLNELNDLPLEPRRQMVLQRDHWYAQFRVGVGKWLDDNIPRHLIYQCRIQHVATT